MQLPLPVKDHCQTATWRKCNVEALEATSVWALEQPTFDVLKDGNEKLPDASIGKVNPAFGMLVTILTSSFSLMGLMDLASKNDMELSSCVMASTLPASV